MNDKNNNSELLKTKAKIKKETEQAIEYASKCNHYHIRHLIYSLRLNRIRMLTSEKVIHQSDAVIFQLDDDTLKYALSLGVKYGHWKNEKSLLKQDAHYNYDLVVKLINAARRINGLFDHEMLLNVYHINRDAPGGIKFEMPDLKARDVRIILRDYGIRIERHAISGKESTLKIPELVVSVLKRFAGVSELFKAAMSISLEDFCFGVIELNSLLTNRLKDIDDKLNARNIGRVYDTFNGMSIITRMMIFTDSELESNLEKPFIRYIKEHCFESDSLNHNELRYHYLSRRPFFVGDGFTIISPDLIFDSIMDNLHYSLLENPITKDAYQSHCGNQFLTNVKEAIVEYGYVEISREVELYEGKNKIGDIDIILHNPLKNHSLLIECKGHKLPLDVQFRAEGAVVNQINKTKKWEKKVVKRIDNLKKPNPGYKIEGDWDYLIVTLMPEPLSHDSSLMIFTINELQHWLKAGCTYKKFSELYQDMYIDKGVSYTEESLKSMMESEYFYGINSL